VILILQKPYYSDKTTALRITMEIQEEIDELCPDVEKRIIKYEEKKRKLDQYINPSQKS